MSLANKDECSAVGIDPKVVERYRRRFMKLLADMEADKIAVFGGGDGSTFRPISSDGDTALLILADVTAENFGGGAGAYSSHHSDDGLLRGES